MTVFTLVPFSSAVDLWFLMSAPQLNHCWISFFTVNSAGTQQEAEYKSCCGSSQETQFRAGPSQYQPQATLQSRIVCIILTRAICRWRSASCSLSPEKLNDCRIGLQTDFFPSVYRDFYPNLARVICTETLPKLEDIGTGGFYLVRSSRSFHNCHGHKEVTDSVSGLRKFYLS